MGMDEALVVIVRPDGHIAERILDSKISAGAVNGALSKAVAKFVAFEARTIKASEPGMAVEKV